MEKYIREVLLAQPKNVERALNLPGIGELSFLQRYLRYLITTCQLRNSFTEEKKSLLNQPGFTLDVNVYKIFFRWYAKNSKGSFGPHATLSTVLASVGIFWLVLTSRGL